jgi:hypothetical protein
VGRANDQWQADLLLEGLGVFDRVRLTLSATGSPIS